MGSPLFRRAATLGTGYTWNRVKKTQNAFILWHTGQNLSPVDGWSGSALCLGKPSDDTSKALVFQNFQRMCNGNSNSSEKILIKAGFVLPAEIRSSFILGAENHIHRKYETNPVKSRSLKEPHRRFVSGF